MLVRDAGDGIPEAFAAQIGRRFSANGISPDSAGLGLSIVAAVAASHDARIVMQPGAGGGFEIGLEMKVVEK